jgi:hypothetical protein
MDYQKFRHLSKQIDADKRAKHYRRQVKAWLLILLGAGSIVIGVYLYERNEQFREREFRARAMKASGVLDNLYTERRGRFDTTYTVTYTFLANGYHYNGTATLYRQPQVRNIEILYDPMNPTDNRVADSTLTESHFWQKMLVLTITLTIVSFLWEFIKWATSRNR